MSVGGGCSQVSGADAGLTRSGYCPCIFFGWREVSSGRLPEPEINGPPRTGPETPLVYISPVSDDTGLVRAQ
jgi:hypothetical protein